MKLMLIIISNEDTQDVTKGLLKEKFYVTKLATTGGLLHGGNTTLLLGVADEEVNRVKEIVSVYAKTRKKKVTTGELRRFKSFSFYQLTFRLKEQLFLLSMLMNITKL
ncbi:MAG: cyclic-di-AMP receptor [Christensenellales bacterium]